MKINISFREEKYFFHEKNSEAGVICKSIIRYLYYK